MLHWYWNLPFRKAVYASNDSRSSCSKMSCDSFLYNCSSNKSAEELPSLLERNLGNGEMDSSSGYGCAINLNICNPSAPSSNESPQPLVIPRFDKEVIVNGNRPLLAMKSLVWKNRPNSENKSFFNLSLFLSPYSSVSFLFLLYTWKWNYLLMLNF